MGNWRKGDSFRGNHNKPSGTEKSQAAARGLNGFPQTQERREEIIERDWPVGPLTEWESGGCLALAARFGHCGSGPSEVLFIFRA